MQKSAPVRAQVLLPAAVILAAALMLAGCTPRSPLGGGAGAEMSKGAAGARQKTKDIQFADIPVPKGRKINIDKTVVVGTDVWYGQLTYDTNHSAESMFEFYARELPGYGWRKITSVRAQTSFMTYDRQNRVMTVAITPNRIIGSEVMISVSPREQPKSPAPPSSIAPAAAPVMSQPLAPLNPLPPPR